MSRQNFQQICANVKTRKRILGNYGDRLTKYVGGEQAIQCFNEAHFWMIEEEEHP